MKRELLNDQAKNEKESLEEIREEIEGTFEVEEQDTLGIIKVLLV